MILYVYVYIYIYNDDYHLSIMIVWYTDIKLITYYIITYEWTISFDGAKKI